MYCGNTSAVTGGVAGARKGLLSEKCLGVGWHIIEIKCYDKDLHHCLVWVEECLVV